MCNHKDFLTLMLIVPAAGQSQGLGDIDDDHGAVEYPRDIGITPSVNYLHNIQECAVYCS